MKKLILMLVMLVMLSGCNRQMFDFDYEFHGVYFNDGDQWHYIEIDSWKGFEDGDDYQFTKDGVTFLINSRNIIMVERRTDEFDEMLGVLD